jgi:hypothetical protein
MRLQHILNMPTDLKQRIHPQTLNEEIGESAQWQNSDLTNATVGPAHARNRRWTEG